MWKSSDLVSRPAAAASLVGNNNNDDNVGISRGQQHQKAISNLCLGWWPVVVTAAEDVMFPSSFFTAAVKAIRVVRPRTEAASSCCCRD